MHKTVKTKRNCVCVALKLIKINLKSTFHSENTRLRSEGIHFFHVIQPPVCSLYHWTTTTSCDPECINTQRVSLCHILLFFKETAAILNLFDIMRGSAFLCGVTGSCRYVRIDFKDVWWGVFWSKKMKVLRQAGSEWVGGYLGEVHHKSLWRGHIFGF